MPNSQTRFQRKKKKILDQLARSEPEYTDLSPKGAVDDGIRELIDEINQLDGLVTTSSCAGRLSVFLEGRKWPDNAHGTGIADRRDSGPQERSTSQVAVPGGKGAGGRWLYVSHEPLQLPSNIPREEGHLTNLFGLIPHVPEQAIAAHKGTRYVRIAFEPMVRLLDYPAFELGAECTRYST